MNLHEHEWVFSTTIDCGWAPNPPLNSAPPARASALSFRSASSAPLVASVQAGPVSFIR